jgi:elongator complex protein 1
MSMLQILLDCKSVDVAFSRSGTRLAVVSDTGVALFAFDLHKRPVARPSLLWSSRFSEGHLPRHVTFVGDDQLCVLTDMWAEEEAFVWTNEDEQMLNKGPVLEPGRVSSIAYDVDFSRFLVNLCNGERTSVIEVATGESVQTTPITVLPSFTPEVKTVILEAEVGSLAQL